MAEEDKAQAEEQAQESEESTDDLAKQLTEEKERLAQELQAERDKYKKEVAGLNRKVSELEKERMTDEERLEAERRERETAVENAKRQVKDYELQLARAKAFNDKGVKSEIYDAAAKIAGAESADDVYSATEELAKSINDLVQGGVEEFKNERAKNAYVPQSGGDADTLTRADVLKMSEEQIAAIPGDKLDAAMKRF